MYFDLDDEQKAIADMVEAVLRDAVPAERAVPLFDAGVLDRGLWASLSGLGLGAILVPEASDGLEMGLLTLVAIQEKLGWAAAPVPVATNALAAWLIATAGTAEQQARWLAALMSGETIAAFALADQGGTLPSQWAVPTGLQTGAKPSVAWGLDADILIVGVAGGVLALVDPTTPGVVRTQVEPVDRSQPIADVTFVDAVAETLSASPEQVGELMDALYVLAAADACGAGNRALALAVDYAKTRKQFDRLIGTFQGIKHQLADRTVEMEPVRYLVWYAAHAWDAIPDKRSYAAALAKAHATDVAVRTARAAVEAHGGIGYTWEYPLHIYLKRAMFDRAALGLPASHRARAADLAGW